MARAPKTGTAVANWDEELAKYAKQAVATTGSGGGEFLSTKGGVLSYQGSEVPDNLMNTVILDHVFENHFYTARFDPNNPASPVCFAFGRDVDEMAPHADSTEPQSDTCKDCPQNKFGTADTGRGKACGNIRRLALMTEDGLEDVENATVAFLKVPVMSCKGWDGYVKDLERTKNRPPFAVVTEVSVVDDETAQFKVKFKLAEDVPASAIKALIAKHEKAAEEIMFPYQQMEAVQPPPRRGAQRQAAAPAAKGKAAPAAKGRKF